MRKGAVVKVREGIIGIASVSRGGKIEEGRVVRESKGGRSMGRE